MVATHGIFQTPWLISWPLRITAGFLLLYMLVLITSEFFGFPDLGGLFVPYTIGFAQSTFILIYLINILLLLLWAGFANRSLSTVVQPKLKSQPLMASLWFVIPGAFAFMPWPVIRELYMASRQPEAWESAESQIIGWWWIVRIVSCFAMWSVSAPPSDIRGVFFQAVIVAELTMQLVIITRMTRWQIGQLKPSAADVF